MRHSYSRTSLYKGCPRRYYFQRKRNWKEEGENIHQGFGKAYHAAIEVLWQKIMEGDEAGAIPAALAAFWTVWRKEKLPEGEDLLTLNVGAKRPDIAEQVITAYAENRKGWMEKFELLGVEVWFEESLGTLPTGEPLTYCGYIDLLARDGFGVHPIDLKTTSQGGEKGFYSRFLKEYDQSSQMEGYARHNHLAHPDEAGEVYVDVALIHEGGKRTGWDGRLFTVIPVNPDRQVLESWKNTQRRWSLGIWESEQLLERGAELDYAFPKNTESCVNKYGICPFLDVCRYGGDPRRLETPPIGFVERAEMDRDEQPKLEERKDGYDNH